MINEHTFFDLIDKVSDIGEINIPIYLLKRGVYEEWALRERIYGFSGMCAKIPAAGILIQLLKELGLINYKLHRNKQLVELTNLGFEFSKLRYFEKDRLSKPQGLFLIKKCIKKSGAIGKIFTILKLFGYDNAVNCKINCQDRRIGRNEEKIIRLLQQLKVAFFLDGEICIAKDDYDILIEVISNECVISEEELLALLEKRREVGLMAEELAEFSERDRLQKLGRDDLAGMVKRMSEENICAGYDIASFDNEKSGLSYDRFIEVKGNVSDEVKFFITKNELELASCMKSKYWVYCVVNVKSEEKRKIVKLKNPFYGSSENNRLRVEPVVWRCELLHAVS